MDSSINDHVLEASLDSALGPPGETESSDVRLYVPDADGWEARIKNDSEKVYCYQKNQGENYFHLILSGEIYLVHGNEKLCLSCALRRGVVTPDRLYWQRRVKRVRTLPT